MVATKDNDHSKGKFFIFRCQKLLYSQDLFEIGHNSKCTFPDVVVVVSHVDHGSAWAWTLD